MMESNFIMNMGIFHVLPSKDINEFEKVLQYDWVNCFILEAIELDMLRYGLKRIKENGKKAYIFMNFALSEGNRRLKPNWKRIFQTVYNTCEDAGALDILEGWYYDEPFLDSFEENDFIQVSKFGKEVLNRKNFAIFSTPEIDKSIICSVPQLNDRPMINENNLKYVTDIAYDFYSDDIQKQMLTQKIFKYKLGERIHDLAIWYIPPIGVLFPEWKVEESEKICLNILQLYQSYIKSEKNLGGVFLYTWEAMLENGFVHGDGKKYLTPNEKGEVLWNEFYTSIKSFGRKLILR